MICLKLTPDRDHQQAETGGKHCKPTSGIDYSNNGQDYNLQLSGLCTVSVLGHFSNSVFDQVDSVSSADFPRICLGRHGRGPVSILHHRAPAAIPGPEAEQ